MSQIYRNIHVGGVTDAKKFCTKYSRNRVIINVAAELNNKHADHNFELNDDSNMDFGNVILVWKTVMNIIDKERPETPILVHCHMGLSRSVATILYYIMETEQIDYNKAMEYFKDQPTKLNLNFKNLLQV